MLSAQELASRAHVSTLLCFLRKKWLKIQQLELRYLLARTVLDYTYKDKCFAKVAGNLASPKSATSTLGLTEGQLETM